jgi:hypothetical protein
MTATELIEAAIAAGLDGVAVTAHWLMEGAEEAQRLARRSYGLPVLRGIEVRTAGMGDVLVFGCYRDFPPNVPWDELRRVALDAGGVLIPAHPFRRRDPASLWSHLQASGLPLDQDASLAESLDGLTALEVLNGGNEPGENEEAARLAAILGLPGCGGSDAHWTGRVGRAATWFPGSITTDEELVAALKQGNYRAIDRSAVRNGSRAR